MHIPEHLVEDIRSRSDIVEIVGEHVHLTKRGKNYLGLCPFHSEKTPSFNVNPELGIYKCFGCGKSGNVYKFMMEHNGMTFPDAVKSLAQRVGIVIEEDEQTAEQRESQNRHDAAHRALAHAADFFQNALHSPKGSLAMRYINQRGFDDRVVMSFGLGYSFDEWQTLCSELLHKGYSEQCIEDAGLVVRRDDGSIHDRFRGRVMFPIHDSMGRVVGFGARSLSSDKTQAKYINSPQSLVYDKSKVLYGLYQAKQSIRQQDRALLTEGYADTISLHQFGFSNAIASSGTALTADQLRLLARYTKNVVIVYDGDEAGLKAATRGVEIALEQGFDVSVVVLPNGEDPDTFVHEHGAGSFESYLREARSFPDFLADRFRSQGMFATAKGQADAVRELMRLVGLIRDPLHREFLIRSLAQKFSLREELLYAELKTQGASTPLQPIAKRNPGTPIASVSTIPSSSSQRISPILAEERALLRWAVKDQTKLGLMVHEFGINELSFPTPAAQHIFRAVEHAVHNGVEIGALLTDSEHLNEEEQQILSDLLFSEEQPSENWKNFEITINEVDITLVIPNALLRLRLQHVLKELAILQQHIREHGDDIDALQRFQLLVKMRTELEEEIRQIHNEGDEDE